MPPEGFDGQNMPEGQEGFRGRGPRGGGQGGFPEDGQMPREGMTPPEESAPAETSEVQQS